VSESLIYKNAFLYESLMLALYGAAYFERYRAIADLIPAGATVTDLCCGPATVFQRYLKAKGVQYTGLDINARFVGALTRNGGRGLQWDMHDGRPFPPADYVLMHASLYHFLPDPHPIVARMLAAANQKVLIAEPIRNMADSPVKALAWLAKKWTNAGTGEQAQRFDENRLDSFFEPYQAAGAVEAAMLMAGGREKLYILRVQPGHPASVSSGSGANAAFGGERMGC
jgi:hypothetical protein